MKILVLNVNGMVGHVVALYLYEHHHHVIGYDESKSELLFSETGSLYNTDKILQLIQAGDFDTVINCTAIINQYAESDKAEAIYVNAFIPHFLEKITAGTKTIVVHRSTDCIYSGKRGNYDLNDTPDAESFYARTKAIGELINDKDITIRTSLVGPEQEADRESLFNWFLNQKGDVKGFANAIWTGLTTIEFAKEIEYLLLHKAHGLFQCVPNHSISKYELLQMFEKVMPGSRNIIRVDNKLIDKSLIQRVGDYGLEVLDYEPMMKDMVEWISNHKALYPHYNVK